MIAEKLSEGEAHSVLRIVREPACPSSARPNLSPPEPPDPHLFYAQIREPCHVRRER